MLYSVLTEPVIPVLMEDGSEKSVGIKEAFLNAHKIKDILGNNPLERYAVLRLLIAFAMDMLHPETGYDRADLLQKGGFDADALENYITVCEKDGPRFDLFDEEHPFLQSRYSEELDSKARKPAAVILHALPSGNNHIFIDHRLAEEHRISFPDAFRALCASYVFCVSGTAGPSSVNNTPPLFAIVIGQNLFETIVINMISVAEAGSLPYGIGEVAWRQDKEIIPRMQVASVSLLEGMTWMPRRITLIPAEDGQTIDYVYCQAGLNFQGNDLWCDPHVPRFRKKDDTFGTVKPEIGREVWRDAGTLLYDHDSKRVRQPLAIRCMANLFDEEDFPDWIPIRVAGLITNQAAYTGWCEDELSVPSVLLYNQEKADAFRDDVRLVEALQSQIYSCVQRYYDKPRSGSVTGEHEVATQCQMFFLKGAHDLVFGNGMAGLCEENSISEHNQAFCDSVRLLVRDTLRNVLYSAGNDTDAIMRQVEAEKWIWISYQKLIKEREELYAGS